MASRTIRISGARTHNLRNVDVEIPQRQLTVVTGPSGSGKSSLAFNTLYAEGQRRFVESMSTYVRQFLERMERPDVDLVEGVLPAIAIEQNNSVKNARSTVATATELADYLRLFITWAGETHCPGCGAVVGRETPQTVAEQLIERHDGERVVVVAPLMCDDETRDEIGSQLIKGGYYRIWRDQEIVDLKEIDRSGLSSLEVVAGRLRISEEQRGALTEVLESAFAMARGGITVYRQSGDGWSSRRFSSRFACDVCELEFTEPRPHLFSYNSPLGACVECQGYGRVIGIDLDKVIPNRALRLDELPIAPWNSPGYDDVYDDLEAGAKKHKLRLDVPIEQLSAEEWEILYSGRGKWYGIKGFFDWLESKKYKVHVRVLLSKYRSYTSCSSCGGSRLRPESLYVRFREKTIADLFAMNVGEARRFWEYLALSKPEEAIAGHLRREIVDRLVYLDEVGLSYLTLDRQTRTLSGGEAQRINLAAALGAGLTETLYVIDEPTVGLHPRDSERLLNVLRRLRNSGNTVVVVEHDPTMIDGADYIVELGPGAGDLGGRLLYAGEREGWSSLVPEREGGPEIDEAERPAAGEVRILGASENNLKNIDVKIPLGKLVAITGVSGSGKSTLIRSCLFNAYQRRFRGVASVDVGTFRTIEGLEQVDDVQFVDQSPIGRSSRSNPATYVKAWDEIRKLMAETTSARLKGVSAGMFSFNVSGGRCDTCEGTGSVLIDMQFLADVEVVCDQCDGKRFSDKVLAVTYKSRNIDQILELTVDEAIRFFIDRRAVIRKLHALRAVGLGYLRLGQSTASLSGGEAQRLKLASFLLEGERKKTRRLFLFDEPTTGLHSTDVDQLLQTFRGLIAAGHSVVVIEHNTRLIEASDWVIDLGPEGGDAGGELVADGTPREISRNAASETGRYLFAREKELSVAG
jgi:excinuclease ABC subunit A